MIRAGCNLAAERRSLAHDSVTGSGPPAAPIPSQSSDTDRAH
jgi:hypothetical protein